MKDVSLYIPCFNAAETISCCLEAIFNQSYPLKEVVVVDDGSTDNSREIALRYPVRLIRHENNLGLAIARNTAVTSMDAEFIAALDADCVPEKDWLKNLMENLKVPEIAGAGGKLVEKHCSAAPDLWRSVHMRQCWGDQEDRPPFLFGSNTVFRREALIKAGLYDKSFKTNYEDVDICERLKSTGNVLAYEPRAVAVHLRQDDICSLLDNYWSWHLGYYERKDWYSSPLMLISKLKENIGLANRYMEEDIALQRYELVYLDFLLALHHSLKDFKYFYFYRNGAVSDILDISSLSCGLTLLDLTFFSHVRSKTNGAFSLMPQTQVFLQNFFALSLVLGHFIYRRFFEDENFIKILYKHLFLSIYKTHNTFLLDKLSNLIACHHDWNQLIQKNHPLLNSGFLEVLSLSFQPWLEALPVRFPGILERIQLSAEEMEQRSF